MREKITFLGIETSCDETAAAVVRENDKGTADIMSNIVSSQIDEHKKFGGVVPELAARAHLENIDFIVNKSLQDSKISLNQIDGIAATAGPGLMVCLTIGLNMGKSIAAFSNKPFIGVNHLEGHALSPGLENKIEFPYLLLLISGGHTQFLIVKDVNSYEQLGTTIWSPLASGLLTGKYIDANPSNTRINLKSYKFLKDAFHSEEYKERHIKVKLLKKLADDCGIPLVNLALCWCLKNKNVSTVILGASNAQQIKENLNSLNYLRVLDDNIMDKIEVI